MAKKKPAPPTARKSEPKLPAPRKSEPAIDAPVVEPPAAKPAPVVEAAPAPKPARKSAPAIGTTLSRSTRALEHGTAAAGAAFQKKGFALTPEMDLAFALGYPHLEYIVDDHPDDTRAEMIAYERRGYRLGWPRNIATRWCRVTASKGFKRSPQGATELDSAGKKALKNPAPLSTEEIGLALKAMFTDTTYYEDLRDLVRLYEAFVGPELIVTSITDALEKSSSTLWNHQDRERAFVLHHVGFMLLRLPPNVAKQLRGRLETIFDRRVKSLPNKELPPRKGERGSLIRALDVALHGKLGAERSGERTDDGFEPNDLLHVTDDEAFVRTAATQVVAPDSRLVFLGGEPVLDRILEVFVRFRGQHAALLDNFAEVASDKVSKLLEKIAKGKEAPERAAALLAARG